MMAQTIFNVSGIEFGTYALIPQTTKYSQLSRKILGSQQLRANMWHQLLLSFQMTKSGKDFLLKLTKFCCMDAINEQILMVHKKQIITTRIILHLQYSALITCNRSLMSYYTRTLHWTGDLLYLSLCELQTTITTFHIES